MSYALSEQQCPPTPSESKKTFQGFFPANFLTKNSEETTGPKGRRGTAGEPGFPAISEYIRRLPEDIIMNHILPYTYQTKPRNHLYDIRNFIHDYALVDSIYATQFNEIILLNDLLRFLYINVTPSYGIENIFENVLRRHFSFANKSDAYCISRIRIHYHRNVTVNTDRKIRSIWGLMKPQERTKFINQYIVEP
jgi:hypothetical protein